MNVKNIGRIKRIAAVILCVLTVLCSSAAVFAAESYTVSELDDMVITLPEGMRAITRSSKSTDKYFSVFGLDYNTTMQTFENSDIYLQGMDGASSVTLTVTMTETAESKEIGNYNKLSSDEMTKVRNNFLNMGEYGSCTPDQGEKLVWLIFDATVSSGGKQIKAYQANTVYDGMSVNITIKRNEGNVTAADYNEFLQTVLSVDFLGGGFTTDILPYVIIGGTIVIVLLIVLIIIFAGRAKKRKKRHKNNAILEELANKYNLNDKQSREYDIETFDNGDIDNSEDESGEYVDIIPNMPSEEKAEQEFDVTDEPSSAKDRYVSDDEIDDIINSAKAYKKSSVNAEIPQIAEDEKNSRDFDEYRDISSDSQPEKEDNESDFADEEYIQSEQTPQEAEDTEKDETDDRYAQMFFGKDASEDEDVESDEELVRQQARYSKFNNGYDFFEEAPKKTMGVISSEEIRDAQDYDVINEVEERVSKVEAEGEKKPGAVLTFLKMAGSGIKNFGVHCGYFCKNVSIMIKRKRAAAKRKKAEQERRERARMRAERERQRSASNVSDNGLVRVHSRSEQRNPQNRRSSGQNQRRGR